MNMRKMFSFLLVLLLLFGFSCGGCKVIAEPSGTLSAPKKTDEKSIPTQAPSQTPEKPAEKK